MSNITEIDDFVLGHILAKVSNEDMHSIRQLNKQFHERLPMGSLFASIRKQARKIRRKGRSEYKDKSGNAYKTLIVYYERDVRNAYSMEWVVKENGEVLVTYMRYVRGVYDNSLKIYAPIEINDSESKRLSLSEKMNLIAALMYFVDYRIPKEMKKEDIKFINDKDIVLQLIQRDMKN
jgi:hypothetical protein